MSEVNGGFRRIVDASVASYGKERGMTQLERENRVEALRLANSVCLGDVPAQMVVERAEAFLKFLMAVSPEAPVEQAEAA